jgi:hypothetical protein
MALFIFERVCRFAKIGGGQNHRIFDLPRTGSQIARVSLAVILGEERMEKSRRQEDEAAASRVLREAPLRAAWGGFSRHTAFLSMRFVLVGIKKCPHREEANAGIELRPRLMIPGLPRAFALAHSHISRRSLLPAQATRA